MKTKEQSFIQRFGRHRLAVAACIILCIEILLVFLLPLFMDLNPTAITDHGFNMPPGPGRILGTDDVGRDLFARLVYGGRVSLLVGIAATFISILVGLPLGLLAGYFRGPLETVVMRLADIFMSFPLMILILVIVAVFGSSLGILILVIGITGWPQIAKLIYGNVLSVRKKEYVEAARAMGAGDISIIVKYVLPNSIAPLWIQIAFTISSAIITESALSFLGSGVQPPTPSWGNIIYAAQNIIVLSRRPWAWMPAGICLIVTIVSINFIGEGIRDALDPKMKKSKKIAAGSKPRTLQNTSRGRQKRSDA